MNHHDYPMHLITFILTSTFTINLLAATIIFTLTCAAFGRVVRRLEGVGVEPRE